MSAVKGTRLLPDTTKSGVNRHATSTITKDRLVVVGTPTGGETAINSANAGSLTQILGALQEDVALGATGTVYGAGSIVQLESDGSGTIDPGASVIAVAGASLAASGRVAQLPATVGGGASYWVVGKSASPSQIAATAGAKLLVELCHPTRVWTPAP